MSTGINDRGAFERRPWDEIEKHGHPVMPAAHAHPVQRLQPMTAKSPMAPAQAGMQAVLKAAQAVSGLT